jgi:hypothetical protein
VKDSYDKDKNKDSKDEVGHIVRYRYLLVSDYWRTICTVQDEDEDDKDGPKKKKGKSKSRENSDDEGKKKKKGNNSHN